MTNTDPKILEQVKIVASDQAIADAVLALINSDDPLQLGRMQPYLLADGWQLDRNEILKTFVRGAASGLFALHWQHHCPQCNAVAPGSGHVREVASEAHCGLCDLDFVNKLDQTIEVTFSLAGRYRNNDPNLLQKQKQDMLAAKQRHEAFEKDVPRVSGTDCLHLPLFRELFGDQILTPDQSLSIEHLTLLFTDVRASTQMYSQYGDVRAFKAVRDHYRILFSAVEDAGGIVVKTIGDAVMAAFARSEDALQAAFAAQAAFPFVTDDELEIAVKIGIHTGSALAVTLNGALDYFGTTVNVAARVQAEAEPHELLFTQSVLDSKAAKRLIVSRKKPLHRQKISVKGIAEPIDIVRVNP